MENPAKTITSGFNIGTALKTLGALLLIFAVADLAGWSGAIITPVSFLKSKFGSNNSGQ